MHYSGMIVPRERGGVFSSCTAMTDQAGSAAFAAIGLGAAPPPGLMWNS